MDKPTVRRSVNDRFTASKMDQIKAAKDAGKALEEKLASGELTALGNDRYRVNTGWDRGEVITVRVNANAEAEILGNHGLDTKADGSVALYHRRPAWWGTGTMIPSGLTSVDAVLEAAGLNFDVAQKPTVFQQSDGTLVEVPNTFTNYRTDTETPLGIVGKIYHPAQNREAFGFLEKLFADQEFIPETAGSLRGGRKIFISARMPSGMLVDPEGIADSVEMFLIVGNSHDGSTPITAYATPWRPECENTERFGLRDARYKWTIRHTKNWEGKLKAAAETLKLSSFYAKRWVEEETELLRVSFSTDEVDALISDIWGEVNPEDASKRAVTLDAKRREDIMSRWAVESEKCGRNAYAAERAITGSIDHHTTLKPSDAALKGNRLAALGAAILEESLEEKKTATHKRLLTWGR